MRVSDNFRYWLTNTHINRAKKENADALKKLSSQKSITALHDNPIGATQIFKHRNNLNEIESYQNNINFSKGFVESTETAIAGIQERLARAHELSIAMANDTAGPEARALTAKELAEITEQVIQLANSKYNDRYVFSGFRTRSPAMGRDGAFLGDDGEIFLQIENDHFKKINLSGRNFFETSPDEKMPGYAGIVDTLDILNNGLVNNQKDLIHTAINGLEYLINKASSYQASVGAISNALTQAEKRLEEDQVKETANLSQLQDADIYKASSEFKRTETILQSTLLASNKLLQPSLLNFMK